MYVVIEGVDGSGKTTVTSAVAGVIEKEFPGTSVRTTNEPCTETILGRAARSYLVGDARPSGFEPDPYVVALLMVAARIDMRPSICESDLSTVLLSDRSFLTTYVYQEAVGRRNIDRMHGFDLQDPWTRVKKPDAVFYLEVSPETAIRRVRGRGREHFSDSQISDFVESYGREVKDWNLFRPNQQLPIFVVDAERPVDEVSKSIGTQICGWLRSEVSRTSRTPLSTGGL